MAAGDVVEIQGLAELKAVLRGIAPNLRKRVLRDAMRAGALVVRKAMREAAPVLSPSDPKVQRGLRKSGTLRRAISVRASRVDKDNGNIGYFVNVRPAKGAKFKTTKKRVLGFTLKQRRQVKASQKGSATDPYYWRWVNFGWNPAAAGETRNDRRKLNASGAAKRQGGVKFLQAGADALDGALPEIVKRIGPAIQRLNQTKGRA